MDSMPDRQWRKGPRDSSAYALTAAQTLKQDKMPHHYPQGTTKIKIKKEKTKTKISTAKNKP